MSPASPTRLPWIDHLRTAAIVLVVNMHACVTYNHPGTAKYFESGWSLRRWLAPYLDY